MQVLAVMESVLSPTLHAYFSIPPSLLSCEIKSLGDFRMVCEGKYGYGVRIAPRAKGAYASGATPASGMITNPLLIFGPLSIDETVALVPRNA